MLDELPELQPLVIAVLEDLPHVGKLLRIDLGDLLALLALDHDLATADAVVGLLGGDLPVLVQRLDGQGVGMEGFDDIGIPGNLHLVLQDIADGLVGQVAFAGGRQRTVQLRFVGRRVRMIGKKMSRRGPRTHRMAARRTVSDPVEFTQGFHASHATYSGKETQ